MPEAYNKLIYIIEKKQVFNNVLRDYLSIVWIHPLLSNKGIVKISKFYGFDESETERLIKVRNATQISTLVAEIGTLALLILP